MRLTRLFTIVVMVLLCAGMALAQAAPKSRVLISRPAEWQGVSDATCFSIRSYLVVRDSPDSDTTHRDGSTTCVPTARFRMYSTVVQERVQDQRVKNGSEILRNLDLQPEPK